jgi:hypothetical protein
LSTLLTIISVLTLSSSVPITTAATTIIQQEGYLAQTNDDNTFKIYQNPIYEIQIQHPSDGE